MLLSVVFSFRNEEGIIDELLRRMHNALKGYDYELIFVNDDSTDGSLALLMKHRENDKRIKIINMSKRFGVTPCVFAGLKHANGDAVITMDTDSQDPPEIIPQLIEK